MNESEAGWVTILPFNHCKRGLCRFVIEGRCIDFLGSLSDFSSEVLHGHELYTSQFSVLSSVGRPR